MKRIFGTILIVAAGMIAGAAEVTEIISSRAGGIDPGAEIRQLERLLNRLPHPRCRREHRLSVIFGDPEAAPGVHPDFLAVPWRVVISGGQTWADDLTLASQLGGILLAVHSGAGKKEDAAPLPQWLTAALFQQARERNSTGYYSGNSRRYPAAGALLQSGAKLIPEGFAVELNSPPRSAERLWQQEFCRLLLDLSLLYSPETFGVKIPFFRNRSAAGKTFSAEAIAAEEMPRVVWRNPESIPFPVLEARFQELMKFQIPALDKDGVPTGESEEISLEQLPEKLKKHPEKKVIREHCCRRILEFRSRTPAELAEPLARLAFAVRELSGSAASSAELMRNLQVCRNALAGRKARSAVLDEQEKRSGVQRFAPVFACNWSFSMLNEKERNILDRTEKFFNR